MEKGKKKVPLSCFKTKSSAAAKKNAEKTEKALIPTKRALLIGINYFGQNGQLSGCHNDVDNMKNYLKSCGFTEFAILKDSKIDPKHLLPDCPTKDNIIAAMRESIRKTQAGDHLYVHYSGHGSHLDDQTTAEAGKDEADNQDECICPVDYATSGSKDFGFIRDDDLNTILVKTLKQGARLTVCFDSCHSGSALDLPFRWVPGVKSPDRLFMENNDMSSAGKDVVFISGCMDVQTSADSSFNGSASGAMTWALLSALWDIKKSGKHAESWTWKELVQMMRMSLKKEQYTQVPQLSFENKDQIAKFVDLI